MRVSNASKSDEDKENGSDIISNVVKMPSVEYLPNSIDFAMFDVLWEYELKLGHWARYKHELSDKLNQASTSLIIKAELEESELNIDLSIMKQVNMVSGFRRNIRCAVKKKEDETFVVWEYQKGRRYYPLPRDISVQLEATQSSGLDEIELQFEGLRWSVNIVEMKMTSTNGQKYKFRRTESHAESAISASPVPPAQRTRTVIKRGPKSVEYKEIKSDKEDEDWEISSKKSCHQKKSNYDKCTKGNTKSGSYKSGKRTVIIKGSVPVDPECVEKLKTAHVLSEGNIAWDAMLNQTNIANNNNKFYILQLLEDDDSKCYSVWFRWGRIGYRGQTSLQNFGNNLEAAKTIFCKKFFDKTRNEWSDRSHFEKIPGKYTLIHMDYCTQSGLNEDEEQDQIKKEGENCIEIQESKLDDRIKSLLALICNIRAMEETVMELEYDSTRAPLGKLTTNQISEGYKCLRKIEEFIKKKSFGRDFVECVNEYYTKIPHDFGFHQPPLIKTTEGLKKETELLEVLADIEVAIRTLGKGRTKGDSRPAIDRYYENMCCHIKPVENNEYEYKMIERYLKNTHGRTHLYKMKLRNVFAVEKDDEKVAFMEDVGNRVLLWHGSRLTNWYGILSQGLRIAPPEAPSTGYMFGKGIYFADMATKSGNYCYPSKGKSGLLMLAEVALGNSQRLYDADYNADNLSKGKHSIMGVGSCGPDPLQIETTADGVRVPLGIPVDNEERNSPYSLIYNEYVVYNTAQVKMRYVVEVEFDM